MSIRLPRIIASILLAAMLCLPALAQDCPPPLQPPTQAELQKLAASARDRGFLWRIEKDGRVSHLYGTLHAQKAQWISPGPRVSQALRAANALALEIDVTDPATLLQQAAAMAAQPATPLPAALRARLRERMQAECVPPEALAMLPPEMQVMTLTLAAVRRDGLEAAYGSDLMLALAARAQNKPVHALETVDEQLRAIKPANDADLIALVDQSVRDLEGGLARRVLLRAAESWANSDAGAMQHYRDWCECERTATERAMQQRLLHDRNPVLAERITALHASHGPLFAAVGALHMFGPNGLPDLLRARGFKVTRVF